MFGTWVRAVLDCCLRHISDLKPCPNRSTKLLPSLYNRVIIPSAVNAELGAFSHELPAGTKVASMPWLIVASAEDRKHVQKLREDLDPGEAEAIVLAIEHGAELLLVDDRRARRTATAAGLAVTGLLGIVARAKLEGIILLGKPVVDELIETARFWIGPQLYSEVLTELGEG